MIARFCAIVKDEYSSVATMLGWSFFSSSGDSCGFSRRVAFLFWSEAWVSPTAGVSDVGAPTSDGTCTVLSAICRSRSSARSVMADYAVPYSTPLDRCICLESQADRLADRDLRFVPCRRVNLTR